jgi:molybdopterin synthase catalytic subunit
MFRVTDQPINLQELVDFVADPEAGAVATFIGTTRNNNEGRKVLALDYEAYPEMAEKELARLGQEASEKWPICRMAIVHRLGPVQITEPSVIIAVSAAHREAAFAACRFAIEEIKKTVPIWKKEVYEGGEIWIGTQSGEPLPELHKSS